MQVVVNVADHFYVVFVAFRLTEATYVCKDKSRTVEVKRDRDVVVVCLFAVVMNRGLLRLPANEFLEIVYRLVVINLCVESIGL